MVLKLVTFLVVSAMTAVLARKIMEQVEATNARAKVRARPSSEGQQVTRLKRDPASGVYFPED
jgi:membrane protein implicated in regulation of membrane protease activity